MNRTIKSVLSGYKPIHVFDNISAYIEVGTNVSDLTKRKAPVYVWDKSRCPACGLPRYESQIQIRDYMFLVYQCGTKISCKRNFIAAVSTFNDICMAHVMSNAESIGDII